MIRGRKCEGSGRPVIKRADRWRFCVCEVCRRYLRVRDGGKAYPPNARLRVPYHKDYRSVT